MDLIDSIFNPPKFTQETPEEEAARLEREAATRAEQERRNNAQMWGGGPNGRADYNTGVMQTGQEWAGAATDVGNRYGAQLSGMGAEQYGGADELSAAGRAALGQSSDRYIDPEALAGARGAAGDVLGAGNVLLDMATGPAGPSAAEAMLREGTAATGRQNLALAKSGRGLGGGSAAFRAAMQQNSQQMGAMNPQLATLRATEDVQRRQQQQQAALAAGQTFAAAGGLQTGIGSQVIGGRNAAETSATQLGLGLTQAGREQAALGGQMVSQGGGFEAGGVAQGADTAMTAQQLAANANTASAAAANAQEQNITNRIAQDQQAAQASRDASNKKEAGWIAAGGTLLGSLSDRRAKEDIVRVDAPIDPWAQVEGGPVRTDDSIRDPWAPRPRELVPAPRVIAEGDGNGKSEAASFADGLRKLKAKFAPDHAPGGSTPTPEQAADTISKTPAYAYQYRDPERHGDGERVGVMAQDLEKTPAGARAVDRGPDGLRRVDTGELTTINTAALHNQQERQDALERRLRAFEVTLGLPDLNALDEGRRREASWR